MRTSKYLTSIEVVNKKNKEIKKINFFLLQPQAKDIKHFKLINKLLIYEIIEKQKNKKTPKINFFSNIKTKKEKLKESTISFLR